VAFAGECKARKWWGSESEFFIHGYECYISGAKFDELKCECLEKTLEYKIKNETLVSQLQYLK
jgi:hypothetical protein